MSSGMTPATSMTAVVTQAATKARARPASATPRPRAAAARRRETSAKEISASGGISGATIIDPMRIGTELDNSATAASTPEQLMYRA